MTLTGEAEAARQDRTAKEAADAAAARSALQSAALNAMRATLVRSDSTTMTLAQSGLVAVHIDLANGLVVATDGAVALAAKYDEDGVWVVRVVTGSGAEWTQRSEQLGSLADLGAALKAEAG